jgi:hypothetical protein
MAILWAGNEDIQFGDRSSIYSFGGTAGTHYRSSYVRGAVQLSLGSGSWLKSATATAAADVWAAARLSASAFSTTLPVIVFLRNGSEVFRVRCGASTAGLWEVYQNSTVRAAAGSGALSTSTLYKIDVHYLCSASGYVRVYKDGAATPWIEAAIDTSGWGNIDQIQFLSVGSSGNLTYVSECIFATEDTRNLSILTLAPTGAGDYNTFDGGAYSDVDETLVDTGDALYSGTNNQGVNFALSDPPAGNFAVKQVRMTAFAVRGTTGPSRFGVGVRFVGNYPGDNLDLGTNWAAYTSVWNLNPYTSLGWTVQNITDLQSFLMSIT